MPSDKQRVVPSPRPVAAQEIQLIDRTKEMEALHKAVAQALRGEGGVVFLFGEAGIGKTRMARELGAYARSQGMQVLSGRCPALFRMDNVPPYVLWEEVIKDYLEVCAPEQLFRVIGSYPIEISKLVPELKQKLRAFPQSFPLSPEHSRDRLYEAVSQFITNISRETPLLVILDDLQWTDKSSLLLLQYLARGVHKDSILLLGAYRDTDIDDTHPLSSVLAELNRERLLQSVPLKRMSFDDVSEMIGNIIGQVDVPEEFCKLVFEKTRGNPFFVEEVIRSLKEEEIIFLERNKWKVKSVSKIEFPPSVKSVIKKRINRLDDESQQVMTMASFVGKTFTFEALRSVTGIDEDKLLDLMDRLLKTGLFKQEEIRGKDVCSFADIIVRDVVHEEVGHFKRKKLHGTVGRTLEQLYAKDLDEHLGELALHFLESGDTEKALDYFLKAGDRAANLYANNEAASFFQSALQLLRETGETIPLRAHVLERLGDIKKLVGEYDACVSSWNDARLLRKQLNEKEQVSKLHRKLANLLWDSMGEAKKAEEHHAEARQILEAKPDSVELASLHEDMAHMYYRIGDLKRALSSAQKALQLAEKLNASEVIASSYASLGTIFGFMGDGKKGRECLERGLKKALENDHMETALRIYVNLPALLLVYTKTEKELQRALELFERGLDLARKVGDIYFQSWIGTGLGEMYVGMANIDKALLLSEESTALDRKANSSAHLSIALSVLGYVHQVLGEWETAERYYHEALKNAQRIKDFQSIGTSYGYLGWLHFEKGDYDKAREYMEIVVEALEKAGIKPELTPSHTILIWTYIELGEVNRAENLLDKMHKYASDVENRRLMAYTYVLRAMVFRAQKQWSKASEYFEKSLQEFNAWEATRWDSYIFAKAFLSEYARVHMDRGQEDDRDEAENLFYQALEIFQKLRAKKDIEKTELRLISIGSKHPATKPETVDTVAFPTLITSGYSDLDNLLHGGIPRNYAVALTSPSCDERDQLIKRFLEAGVKEDQITFHIIAKASGLEQFAEEFPSYFYLFICNPQADKIIKPLPNVSKLSGVENLTNISIALTSTLHKLNTIPKSPRRICIEILSDILLQHHIVQARKWIQALIPELKSNGFTTLAVLDPEIHPKQDVRAIVDLFEGEINIHDTETEGGLQRLMSIRKMANHVYSDLELPLRKEKLAFEEA